MGRKLALPPEKVVVTIDRHANTSAASIPLALERMIADGDATSGDTALLVAFGAGLAYAAQVVTVP
jgi:3-oxoacyl-[acyl-carrier-protein] synthase III